MTQLGKKINSAFRSVVNSTSLLVISSFLIGVVAGKNITSSIDGVLFLTGVLGLALYQWIGVRDFYVSLKNEKMADKKAIQKLEKKIDRHVKIKKVAIAPESR